MLSPHCLHTITDKRNDELFLLLGSSMDEKNMKDDGRSFVEEKMELEVK